MAHWLDLFDKELGLDEVPLRQRPMQALFKLFEHDAIEMRAGETRIREINIADHAATPWFRVLYSAVEFWYIDLFGEEAMAETGNAPLEGVVLVRGLPFLLRLRANRNKVEIEGKQTWMYFEDGLGEGEVAHDWIIGGPDLARLDEASRAEVEAQAATVASTLRYVEFRRVAWRGGENEAARQLVVNTLSSLQQAARRMVSSRDSSRGPGWYDLQMAAECALKAVLQLKTGTQLRTHKLNELLDACTPHGVVFDETKLDDFPSPSEMAEWRYGQGRPWRLEFQHRAYLMVLELVRASMAQIPPGMTPGSRLLLRYPPWLSDTGTAER